MSCLSLVLLDLLILFISFGHLGLSIRVQEWRPGLSELVSNRASLIMFPEYL